MHHRHIVHLDLKSANLLLSRDGTAKIADVSCAAFRLLNSSCPDLMTMH